MVGDERPFLPADRFASGRVRLESGRYASYETIGSGPPLLWFEGGPGFPVALGRPDVALLADRFTGVLIDALGVGGTEPPADEAEYGWQGQLRLYDEVRRSLGLGRVTIMGHSWGGLNALLYAATYPHTVDRIIVIGGYAGDASVDTAVAQAEQDRALERLRSYPWFSEAMGGWRETLGTLDSPQAWEAAFAPCWPLYFAHPETVVAQEHISRLRRDCRVGLGVMRHWEGIEHELDFTERVALIRCPVLLLVGEHDFICGPVWSRTVHEHVAGSTLHVIPDAGHMPQYEAPDTVRSLILEWLGESYSAGA